MAITIPDPNGVRLTTGGSLAESSTAIMCVAGAALNPGPVSISALSPSSSGNMVVVATPGGAAGRTRYQGFNILGGVAAGQAPAVFRNCNVEGLAGMTPGEPVYVADDGTLTHTLPTGATNADVIAWAITATKMRLK